MMATDNKIIVGLSGGVDSSVAAFLLLEKGYEVEALFMKNWDEDDDDEYCSASQDLADAQQVAIKPECLDSKCLTRHSPPRQIRRCCTAPNRTSNSVPV